MIMFVGIIAQNKVTRSMVLSNERMDTMYVTRAQKKVQTIKYGGQDQEIIMK